MNKDVIISIKGKQSPERGDSDIIEFMTEGRFFLKDGKYYITYKETEMTGLAGTTTTLKVEGEKVTLMRFGANNSQMVFEKGHKYTGHYETQYGAFTIGVMPSDVKVLVGDSGGEINVEYAIEIGGGQASQNDFHIMFREAGLPNDQHS